MLNTASQVNYNEGSSIFVGQVWTTKADSNTVQSVSGSWWQAAVAFHQACSYLPSCRHHCIILLGSRGT